MQSGPPSAADLYVENRTNQTQSVSVSCRTDTGVVFTEEADIDAGKSARWSTETTKPFQVGIRVQQGPKGSERFSPDRLDGDVTATISRTGISFSTDEGGQSGGASGFGGGTQSTGRSGDSRGSRRSRTSGASGRSGDSRDAGESARSQRSQNRGSTGDRSGSSASSSESGFRSEPHDGGSDDEPRGTGGRDRDDRSSRQDGDTRGSSGSDGRGSGSDDRRDSDRESSAPESAGDRGSDDADDRSRERGPSGDEIYCRSCGEIIKQNAEICPKCGVRNAAQNMRSGRSGAGSSGQRGGQQRRSGGSRRQSAGANGQSASRQPQQQQQQTQSEPSGTWRYGVMFSAGLWLLAGALLAATALLFQSSGLSGMTQSLGLAALIPPVQLLGWVVLPLSLYFDLKYVDYHVDDWPLSGRLYIAAALILPVMTQILGAVALFVGGAGQLIGVVIPLILVGICVRHLRTRSRLVD